jgi:ABC-type multidrug transport system ATPase subunit
LDPTAARHLEQSLALALAGRTVVAIAHRLHTAFDADRVAVMKAGRIVELGTHDDLMAQGGQFAGLWHAWHGSRADDSITSSLLGSDHEAGQAAHRRLGEEVAQRNAHAQLSPDAASQLAGGKRMPAEGKEIVVE